MSRPFAALNWLNHSLEFQIHSICVDYTFESTYFKWSRFSTRSWTETMLKDFFLFSFPVHHEFWKDLPLGESHSHGCHFRVGAFYPGKWSSLNSCFCSCHSGCHCHGMQQPNGGNFPSSLWKCQTFVSRSRSATSPSSVLRPMAPWPCSLPSSPWSCTSTSPWHSSRKKLQIRSPSAVVSELPSFFPTRLHGL